MNKYIILSLSIAFFCLIGCEDKFLGSDCNQEETKCDDGVIYQCTTNTTTGDLYWKAKIVCALNECDADKCAKVVAECKEENLYEDGSCAKECVLGWLKNGDCAQDPRCKNGWNDDGSCLGDCVIGMNKDGSCIKKEGCANGNNPDGSCIQAENCAFGTNEDGSCIKCQLGAMFNSPLHRF